jgi:hypothetical protein
MAHVLRELVNVGELAARRMAGSEHRVDQSGESIRFADDHRRVFAHVLFGQLARQQLRGAAQTAERIFDLVRELPDHQPPAVDLRQQRGLARNALMLSRVADLDQRGRRCRSSYGATTQSTISSPSPFTGRSASSRRRNGRDVSSARSMTRSSSVGIASNSASGRPRPDCG